MFGIKKARKCMVENRLANISQQRPADIRHINKRHIARREPRIETYKFGTIVLPTGEEYNCVVRDVSRYGAKCQIEGAIILPDQFQLTINAYRGRASVRKAWQKDMCLGVAYAE